MQESGLQCAQLAMQQQLQSGRVARQGFFALMSPIQRSEQTDGQGRAKVQKTGDCLCRNMMLCRGCCEGKDGHVESRGEIVYPGLDAATKRMGRKISEEDE